MIGLEKRLMRILAVLDAIRLNGVLPALPKWMSVTIYVGCSIASTNATHKAVLISLYSIIAEYIGP
jgi:uncharacterized membrane protein (GlpM family)